MLVFVAALLISVLGAPAHKVQLGCLLAGDIAEAAITKSSQMAGLFEEIDGSVEKALLATEIYALEQLREQMIQWQIAHCGNPK